MRLMEAIRPDRFSRHIDDIDDKEQKLSIGVLTPEYGRGRSATPATMRSFQRITRSFSVGRRMKRSRTRREDLLPTETRVRVIYNADTSTVCTVGTMEVDSKSTLSDTVSGERATATNKKLAHIVLKNLVGKDETDNRPDPLETKQHSESFDDSSIGFASDEKSCIESRPRANASMEPSDFQCYGSSFDSFDEGGGLHETFASSFFSTVCGCIVHPDDLSITTSRSSMYDSVSSSGSAVLSES